MSNNWVIKLPKLEVIFYIFIVRYQTNDLKLTATAYSIAFDNRITFIAPGSDTGGIESNGLELSASYRLTQ